LGKHLGGDQKGPEKTVEKDMEARRLSWGDAINRER